MLEKELDNVGKAVGEKEAQGLVVTEFTQELQKAQKELDRLRERVVSGNFANFDERAKTIYTRVSSIYPALESLKAPELPWALIMVASIGAISATVLIFLIRAGKSGSKRKRR